MLYILVFADITYYCVLTYILSFLHLISLNLIGGDDINKGNTFVGNTGFFLSRNIDLEFWYVLCGVLVY